MKGKFVLANGCLLKRCVPCRQCCKTFLDLHSQMLRRLNFAMSMSRKLKFLQNLAVHLESIRLRCITNPNFNGKILIRHVSHFIKATFLRYVFMPEGSVCYLTVNLTRIWFAPSGFVSISTKTSEWSNTGFALMIDNVISIIFIFRGAIIIDHTG